MEKAPEIIRDYMNNSTRLYKLVLENLSDGQGKVPLTQEARDFISRLDVITAYELASTYLEQGNFSPSSQLAEEMILISGGAVKAGNDAINVFINDSSMSPTIPNHSMLTIMPTSISLLKEKDIIALYPYGRKMVTLRRIFFLKNQILLIPEDTAHDIISVESLDQVDYVGKVMSYRVDL
jgi:SOS-response transcriptional repressor LexA